MKLRLFLVVSILCVQGVSAQDETLLKLWYTQPATKWVEALPVGNGRLGAMVYGNPSHEEIQLNENTIWAGQPYHNDNPDAKEALPIVRQLIFDGKYDEAQDLVNKKFISRNSQGMPYQTAGSLYLRSPGSEHFTQYYRELNLETAVTTTRYVVDGVTYTREVFASHPDQVIVVRLSANKPGTITFTASLGYPDSVGCTTVGNDELVMSGVTGNCDSIKGAVTFQVQAKIVADGGSTKVDSNAIVVNNADTATLYISIATSFKNYHDISGDAEGEATAYLQSA